MSPKLIRIGILMPFIHGSVYVQQEINIQVGKRSPADYIGQIREQCQSGKLAFGGIDNFSCIQYGNAVYLFHASSH